MCENILGMSSLTTGLDVTYIFFLPEIKWEVGILAACPAHHPTELSYICPARKN
jgi:hypothetical protein